MRRGPFAFLGEMKNAYYFNAYVRVEADSEEQAWERIQGEDTYVCEADTGDAEYDAWVQLVVLNLLSAEPIYEPVCICPPDLLARGGFKGGCPQHSNA